MRNLVINGTTIQSVFVNGTTATSCAVDGIIRWTLGQGDGVVGQPAPQLPTGTAPALPETGGILNPSQAQINATSVGSSLRWNYNGSGVVGTGSVRSITLPGGTLWRMECWGGGTPNNNQTTFISGGYARGDLQVPPGVALQLFISVGERGYNWRPNNIPAGMFSGNPQQSFLTPSSFGGGGPTWVHNSATMACGQGAGATDIRVLANTLMNRILVGSGAGSVSQTAASNQSTTNVAGQGVGNASTGRQNGPTGAVPLARFGFGGGFNIAQGGRRNSGGGGWFGGPQGNNDNQAMGGSSYALTATSFRPVGYFTRREEFILSNAVISQGGAALADGMVRFTRMG